MQFVTVYMKKWQNGNLIVQLCLISSNYNMICTHSYSILYWATVPSSALEKTVPHPSEMWENCLPRRSERLLRNRTNKGEEKSLHDKNEFYGWQHRKLKFVYKVQ